MEWGSSGVYSQLHTIGTCQSIDYMMSKSIPRGCTFKCTVDPMQVQGKPFTHLSDHFALSAVLYLKEEQANNGI